MGIMPPYSNLLIPALVELATETGRGGGKQGNVLLPFTDVTGARNIMQHASVCLQSQKVNNGFVSAPALKKWVSIN